MLEQDIKYSVRALLYVPYFSDRIFGVEQKNGLKGFAGGGVEETDTTLEDAIYRELGEELQFHTSHLRSLGINPVTQCIAVDGKSYSYLHQTVYFFELLDPLAASVNKNELSDAGLYHPSEFDYEFTRKVSEDFFEKKNIFSL